MFACNQHNFSRQYSNVSDSPHKFIQLHKQRIGNMKIGSVFRQQKQRASIYGVYLVYRIKDITVGAFLF